MCPASERAVSFLSGLFKIIYPHCRELKYFECYRGEEEGEILANSQIVVSSLSSDNACASPALITRSLDYLGRQLVRPILAIKFSVTCWDHYAFVSLYIISLNCQFIGIHNYSALSSFSYFSDSSVMGLPLGRSTTGRSWSRSSQRLKNGYYYNPKHSFFHCSSSLLRCHPMNAVWHIKKPQWSPPTNIWSQ